MVYITCPHCDASCRCYFSHNASYSCHTANCIGSSTANPLDRCIELDRGIPNRHYVVPQHSSSSSSSSSSSMQHHQGLNIALSRNHNHNYNHNNYNIPNDLTAAVHASRAFRLGTFTNLPPRALTTQPESTECIVQFRRYTLPAHDPPQTLATYTVPPHACRRDNYLKVLGTDSQLRLIVEVTTREDDDIVHMMSNTSIGEALRRPWHADLSYITAMHSTGAQDVVDILRLQPTFHSSA